MLSFMETYLKKYASPPGFVKQGDSRMCKLDKSIYGLNTCISPMVPQILFILFQHGHVQSKVDYSLQDSRQLFCGIIGLY